jgi:hypothetical protein
MVRRDSLMLFLSAKNNVVALLIAAEPLDSEGLSQASL